MSRSPDPRRDTLLVVADDVVQRSLIVAALGDVGLDIVEAADGAEALTAFAEHRPLLVLMDIQMPVMDGYAACAEMRARLESDAAVVFMTGSDDVDAIQRAYNLGALDFITKPIDWAVFGLRMRYLVRMRKAYVDVQASRRKLDWAQRAAGLGSWELDPATGQIQMSHECRRMLRLDDTWTSLTRAEFLKFVHEDDRLDVVDSYRKVLAGGVADLDFRLLLADGAVLTVHQIAESVRDQHGRPLVVSGTLQDITDHKLAEARVREMSELKSQFLANMSHEIRTPLAGVLGMVTLLQSTPLDVEQKRWIDLMRDAAQHLLSLLNDILDFSKIEAGKMLIAPAAFPLRAALGDVERMAVALRGASPVAFRLVVDGELPEWVFGDQGRLRQILLNLLSNAFKFTSQGSVSLVVSAAPPMAGETLVRFAVQDTGIGIPPEKQRLIFEQFTQVDASLTRHYGGTGLGLAICRELTTLMGGRLGVSSEPGRGAEFWLELPLAVVPAPASATAEPAPKETRPASDRSGLVLLVEDNVLNQTFGRKILERLGLDVEVAANGAEAVEMVVTGGFDLVLMDCQMPVLDGYEATGRIRQLGGAFTGLPIIAMTAHAMPGDREKCLAAGMDDYIAKPVDSGTLAVVLDEWLGAGARPATPALPC